MPWTWSLAYPDGQSARPFSVEQVSENELHVSAPDRVHDGGVNFDQYTATLEIYAVEHPGIRKELPLTQYSEAPVLSLTPAVPEGSEDYEAIWEGIENGFEVTPQEITEYRMTVSANFPVEVTEDCEWLEASLEEDGTLTVTASPSYDSPQSTAEVRLGNTIYMDGEEEDVRQAISFRLGEYTENLTLSHNSSVITGEEYPLSIDYNDLTEVFAVSSNCEWKVTTETEWIKLSESGNISSAGAELEGNPEITGFHLHLEPNFDDDSRSGAIHLSSKTGMTSYRISVTQNAFAGIAYTTTDGSRLMIAENGYSAHRFENGEGRIILKPESENEIVTGAFKDCSTLKTIRLQEALTYVGPSAFSKCTSLEEVVFTNESFRGGDGIMGSAFIDCTVLKEINVPGGAADGGYIKPSTFENCSSLTRVHWDDDLEHIGERAFRSCSSLYELTDKDNECIVDVESEGFSGCKKLTEINVGSTGYMSFYSCNQLSEVNFHGTETIGDFAFAHCLSLETVHFPESLKEIGSTAFESTGLREVLLNKGLERIGEGAFLDCTYLVKVDSDKGCRLSHLGEFAFDRCGRLKAIRLCNADSDCNVTFGQMIATCGNQTLKSLYLGFVNPPVLNPANGYLLSGGTMSPDFKIYVNQNFIDKYNSTGYLAEYYNMGRIKGVSYSDFWKPLE